MPMKPEKTREVTLRVKVDGEAKRAAERMARSYSQQNLEAVLAAFVCDLAEAVNRPGCWEHERVSGWLSSHPWPQANEEDNLWR